MLAGARRIGGGERGMRGKEGGPGTPRAKVMETLFCPETTGSALAFTY